MDTHTMQSARYFIGAAVKFSASMQLRERQFYAWNPILSVDVDRYSAPIIPYGDAAIGMQNDIYHSAESGKRFIHGVVAHFSEKVVKTLTVCSANIHRYVAANSFQSF